MKDTNFAIAKMKHSLLLATLALCLISCMKGKKVDLIIHNANIFTLDDANAKQDAIAIKDGKIIEVGPERQILNKYRSQEEIDVEGKAIYPCFSNADFSIIQEAKNRLAIDLKDVKSIAEIIYLLEKNKTTNKKLIAVNFPIAFKSQAPILLKQIDSLFNKQQVILLNQVEHFALMNKKMSASIKTDKIIINDEDFKRIYSNLPQPSKTAIQSKFKEIQEELLQVGITEITERNLHAQDMKSLIAFKSKLKIGVNCFLNATKENLDFIHQHKSFKDKNLHIAGISITETQQLEQLQKKILLQCELYNKQIQIELNSSFKPDRITTFLKQINLIKKDHRTLIYGLHLFKANEIESFLNEGCFPAFNSINSKNMNQYLSKATMIAIGSGLNKANDPLMLETAIHGQLDLNSYLKAIAYWNRLLNFTEFKTGQLIKGNLANFILFQHELTYNDETNFAERIYIKGKLILNNE